MTDERKQQSFQPTTERLAPGRQQPVDPMAVETDQPDPMLQMSTGRLGGGAMSLVAIAIVVILGVVFYGLNGRNSTAPTTAPTAVAHNSGAPHG
jgi:uncharacterized protein HemX